MIPDNERVLQYLDILAEASLLMIEMTLEDFKRTHGQSDLTADWDRRIND